MAVRNLGKGAAAAGQIRAQVPGARLELRHLDLADLDSVRAFAAGDLPTLDLLINNADVMVPPLTRTVPSPELTRIKASSSCPSHDPAVMIAIDAPDADASAA
jgi:NAD(P)-dependent dehydrogenase (short-subunit alcohol dehydrogenase family)